MPGEGSGSAVDRDQADCPGDRTLKGIYSLDGEKLRICYAYDPELPSPTDFKSMRGDRGYLYVFERVKE
jgi:hypothetical protein